MKNKLLGIIITGTLKKYQKNIEKSEKKQYLNLFGTGVIINLNKLKLKAIQELIKKIKA